MSPITRDDLKPFQLQAASKLAEMLSIFPSEPYKPRFNPDTGDPYPFLGRLKAITGSGKTPMLALTAATLGDAIVLWTTNRGAVISQTKSNLSAEGRYADMLPGDAQVVELQNLTSADWSDIVSAETGLTVILSTVALFNRDGDVLNVHKDRGGTSYWEMLSGKGAEGRRRPLYVVYDEAHGGTKAQFTRLTELSPRAFILASASDLPDDLAGLIRGETSEAKSENLQRQTSLVPTKEVVEAGLLKTRLYFVDCNTSRHDALKEANDKWHDLSQKLDSTGEWPVMCCIVNSTLDGLKVWEILTQSLDVDPRRVAVHLANVDRALVEASPTAPWGQLVDTHKAKKTPEDLRGEGYTHLVWNLSLREGWDEPWAYVAYLDGLGKSTTDISQKIGRFLRQPNAMPFEDGDLNSAYFYFNVSDEEFASLLRTTQSDLESSGYEIISIGSASTRPKSSREVPVKEPISIAKVAESFGENLDVLDSILRDNVPLFAEEDLRAPGKVSTRVLDLRINQEDSALQKDELRGDNAEIRVWDYLISRLAAADSRIATKTGTRFSAFIKNEARFKQRMQFGSRAMAALNSNISTILQRLNGELRFEYEPDQVYEVKPFNMTSPDLSIDDVVKRERYRVRAFQNALHQEYNGLNSFEVQIAEALDGLGYRWCRNPSRTGYGIPIPEIGEGTTNFYPDFLLWTPKTLWAIDPKGSHILNDAIYNKIMGISDVDGMPLKIRVALVLEGQWIIGPNERPKRQSNSGCTVIQRVNSIVRAKSFQTPSQLVADLK